MPYRSVIIKEGRFQYRFSAKGNHFYEVRRWADGHLQSTAECLWKDDEGKVPLPVALLKMWQAYLRRERGPRSIARIYQELDRIRDLMPDNGSQHSTYLVTDDGRSNVSVKSYMRELLLDLSQHIPPRDERGRFQRKPRRE